MITVPGLTAEIRSWLKAPAGGTANAEIVKDEPELAVAKRGLEKATVR